MNTAPYLVCPDVQTILLNLKEKSCHQVSNNDVTNLSLNVKGPKVVTAGDIVADNDAEILNSDHVLCEVTGDVN